MVEDLLAARGIIVSHETVRCWAEKFGRIYANKIRRRAPQFGDKWHLDEVVISINGKRQCHVRAVDADGFVLDQSRAPPVKRLRGDHRIRSRMAAIGLRLPSHAKVGKAESKSDLKFESGSKAPRQIPTLPFAQSRSQPSVRTWSWMKLGGAIIRRYTRCQMPLDM